MSKATLSRRHFLQTTGVLGASLILGCKLSANPGRTAANFEPNAFLRIDTDGKVTLMAPRPEVGTGVRTSLPMLLAEELGVDWKTVVIEQATADSKYGSQTIGGSQSVQSSYKPLRMAAATAATMIKGAAAEQWGVPAAECDLVDGNVVHKGAGKLAPIGTFVAAAAARPVPDASSVVMRDPKDFKIIGKPTKRIDNLPVVTGKAVFGMDCKVPGMKYAVIVRPHAFGGRATAFDDSGCKAIAGFAQAFLVESGSGGVAAVGKDTWSAMKAAEALKVTWDEGTSATLTTADLTARFKQAVQPFPDPPGAAVKTIEAVYELPYLSHAPMEPMNCTASVTPDKCEVWAPTQVPDSCRNEAAKVTGLPAAQVTVHLPLVGGGFGRRLSAEYVTEAVEISKKIAAPVQLIWTRTDDLQHDHYRPMNYHAMKGSVGSDGLPMTFYHQQYEAGGRPRPNAATWSNLNGHYTIPEAHLMVGRIESPVPNGAWRSVANTYLGFVRECFFDELCAAAGKDPVEARMAIMHDDRLKATLQLAVQKAGWGTQMKAGWGRGIACFGGFGSYVTQIAEVECIKGKVKVHRVVSVVDCGLVVNPLGFEAQVQGATMDAIATTLYSAITIENGGAAQKNWDDFRWAKMSDAPMIEVYSINQTERPGGAGEVGYPAAVAAIGNAIFAATGKRVRKLPVSPEDLA